MKKSIRHIAIALLGLLSSVALLVGMVSKITSLDVGAIGQVGNNFNVSINGFETLSFSFSNYFTYILTECSFTESRVRLYEIILGIISWAMLVVVFTQIITLTTAFFRSECEDYSQLTREFFVWDMVVAVAYMIMGIVLTVNGNLGYENANAGVSVEETPISFKTGAWIPFLLQLICVIAYAVCDKQLPDEDGSASTFRGKSVAKGGIISTSGEMLGDLISVLTDEVNVVSLIREYHALSQSMVISNADYNLKRERMLVCTTKTLKMMHEVFSDIGFSANSKAEELALEAIKGYQGLLDDGLITRAEFHEKLRILILCGIY